jgi:hypothetical protein
MRAVIDTNVLLSALLWGGTPHALMEHVRNGTVTLKAQEADTNSDGDFGDITDATSGSITAAVSPKSGMIALDADASIKRYLRWQLAFGTANTATFACAFIRN